MWVYLDRAIISQVMEVLGAAGKTQIAAIIEERIQQDTQDAKVDARYREAARAVYQVDGELEFDPTAVVSKGEDAGAYVMGWQWVADEEIGIESDRELETVDN